MSPTPRDEQLLHAQRYETLGRLAGAVVHDLNNVFMSILMGAEILRRTGLGDMAEQAVERITSSARLGAENVRQLLTLARGYPGDSATADPARVVADVERMLRKITPRSISIATDVDADVRRIACDAAQVLQLLLNLGLNARDAMPDGGMLLIHAKNADSYVMLSVSDTGTGIPPEILDRIFEPFFTTKAPDAATGLGLATARSIVRSHGGFIDVDSAPGATAFNVFLPAVA
ncbi:MAG TPA: ATP-binding protein [Thermoanaerobaculia bacterium]|nr:ATP-binding protein [Thermoanaerobaculia bacterium]